MYLVKRTTQFRRDTKLCQKRGKDMDKFKTLNELLIAGRSLPPANRDHLLSGNWKGHRECHIEPDWLLIYRILPQEGVLEYVRMGSHSDLFK